MYLCLSAGIQAKTGGLCCIAAGDGVVVRGAFQVGIGEKITLPTNLSKKDGATCILEMTELNLTYQALGDQKFAPASFAADANKAITFIIAAIEKHFGKNTETLMKEVEVERQQEIQDQNEKLRLENEALRAQTETLRVQNEKLKTLAGEVKLSSS